MNKDTWDALYKQYRERGMTHEQAIETLKAHDQAMDDMIVGGEPKVATTQMLRALHERSVDKDYNRLLSEQAIAELDNDGIHALLPMIVHRHAQGEDVEPHVRTRALLKFSDRDEPREAFIDVTMDDYMALPTMRAVKDAWARGQDYAMPDGQIIYRPPADGEHRIPGPRASVSG